jgi:hypothetical protein
MHCVFLAPSSHLHILFLAARRLKNTTMGYSWKDGILLKVSTTSILCSLATKRCLSDCQYYRLLFILGLEHPNHFYL